MYRQASIDIGKKNFSEWVDEIPKALLDEYTARVKKFSLTQRKLCCKNESISEIVHEMLTHTKCIHFGVYDLRDNKESDDLDIPTRRNIIKHLEDVSGYFEMCDKIIIEQQFVKLIGGKKAASKTKASANFDAVKIQEIVTSWIITRFPDKEIIVFSAKYKTHVFGAPIMNDKERKLWSVDKAIEVFKLQKNKEMLLLYKLVEDVKYKRNWTEEKVKEYLQPFKGYNEDVRRTAELIVRRQQKKMDDVSDAMLQSAAAKYRVLLAGI